MRSRGRKPPAELTVVPIGLDTRRPDPPACLGEREAATWRAIVRELPGGWISAATEPLLVAYCQHNDTGTRLSGMIDRLDFQRCDKRRLGRLLVMRARETAAASSLATRMRLTQQSRISPRTAGRRTDGHSGDPPPWAG